MAIIKEQKVRLRGKALQSLNNAIHAREGDSCALCGVYVAPGVKFHHEPCGPSKSDTLETGVLLCMSCHHERHFGAVKETKTKIQEYLAKVNNN